MSRECGRKKRGSGTSLAFFSVVASGQISPQILGAKVRFFSECATIIDNFF